MIIVRQASAGAALTLGLSQTDQLWPLVRQDADVVWVRVSGTVATIETAHRLPGGAWLIHGPAGAPLRVLHRANARPGWLPPALVEVSSSEPPSP
jgi:hypothetical protein